MLSWKSPTPARASTPTTASASSNASTAPTLPHPRIRGSGLGLSIVAALVAAHGGKVEVESEKGLGSTFRVRIPRLLPR